MLFRVPGLALATALLALGTAALAATPAPTAPTAPTASPAPAPSPSAAGGLRGEALALVDRIVEGSTDGNPRAYQGIAAPTARIVDGVAPFVFAAPSSTARATVPSPAPQSAFDAWSLGRDGAPVSHGKLVRDGDLATILSDGAHVYATVPLHREPDAGAGAPRLSADATVTFDRTASGLTITSFSWVPQAVVAEPRPSATRAAVVGDAMLAPVKALAAALQHDSPASDAGRAAVAAAFTADPLIVFDIAPFRFAGPTAARDAALSLESQEAAYGITQLTMDVGAPEAPVVAATSASFVVPATASFTAGGGPHHSSGRWLFVVVADAAGTYRIAAAVWSRTSVG